MTEKLKKGTIKVGKYKVGLPGSDSYKAITPKSVKIVGETLLFIGSGVAIIAGAFTLPGWVVVTGSLAGLAGRYIAKCFSE
jgi:membrane protein YqaA with SNARE-associated domain